MPRPTAQNTMLPGKCSSPTAIVHGRDAGQTAPNLEAPPPRGLGVRRVAEDEPVKRSSTVTRHLHRHRSIAAKMRRAACCRRAYHAVRPTGTSSRRRQHEAERCGRTVGDGGDERADQVKLMLKRTRQNLDRGQAPISARGSSECRHARGRYANAVRQARAGRRRLPASARARSAAGIDRGRGAGMALTTVCRQRADATAILRLSVPSSIHPSLRRNLFRETGPARSSIVRHLRGPA
jgi:hypothetical protein